MNPNVQMAFAALAYLPVEEITLTEVPAAGVMLLELDTTRPGAIRRRNSQFWLSSEDGQLLRQLRRHGANTRFSLLPSGVTARFIPLDRVIHCAEGDYCVAQIRSLAVVDLSASSVKEVRP